MSFEIEIVSEKDTMDYEVWTCKRCGRSVCTSVGADIACCPCEFEGNEEE